MAYDTNKLINLGHLKTAMTKVHGEVTYTNTSATTAALGGIAKGTTFDGVKLSEVLTELLYPYVPPTVTMKANAAVHELGASTTRTFTITVTKGSADITGITLEKSGSAGSPYVLAESMSDEAATFTATQTVSEASETYTAKVYDSQTDIAASASVTLTGVNPFYYGVVSSAPEEAADVIALKKLVQSKGTKTLDFTTAANTRYCFAYPADYGDLSSAKDENGFENINDFTQKIVTLTNAAGASTDYFVYTYNNDVTAGAMKFTFSL